MAVDLYILGTSHSLQCGGAKCNRSDIRAFDAELRKLCETLNIKRVAEEMTADGLAYHEVAETIGRGVARDIAISYQAVDLSLKERRALSIDDSIVTRTVQRWSIFDGAPFREAFDDLADGIRERVWVARLLSEKDWPTLFICGADHAVSVRKLCRALGMDAKVVHRDYKP